MLTKKVINNLTKRNSRRAESAVKTYLTPSSQKYVRDILYFYFVLCLITWERRRLHWHFFFCISNQLHKAVTGVDKLGNPDFGLCLQKDIQNDAHTLQFFLNFLFVKRITIQRTFKGIFLEIPSV